MGNTGCAIRQPSVRERALKRFMGLGVSLAVAASMAVAPSAAFAETAHVYEDATITITQPSPAANDGATFDAYKIFDADIDGQNRASHVAWSSQAAKTTTMDFLNGLSGAESYATWLADNGITQQGAGEIAQNAADFIAFRISEDADNTYFNSSPDAKVGKSFADRFARAVQASSIAKTTTSGASGNVLSGTEGYYLIVMTPETIGQGEFGSAPMWIPLGGELSTIQSKEASATMKFEVQEDKTYATGPVADVNMGQNCAFNVVGTYPSNIESYPSFSDTYTITMPEHMSTLNGKGSIRAGDFSVILSGAVPDDRFPDGQGVIVHIESISGVSISVEGRQVTVRISDVKGALDYMRRTYPDVNLKGIAIGYSAHLDPGAVIGAAGNESTAVRTYTKDPVSLDTTNSETQSVKLFTYQAQFTKIDKTSQAPIEGAGFYITAATDYPRTSDTVYVQENGSLSREPHEFFSGPDGTFSVSGIDEGVYTIHENTVPTDYMAPDSDTVLTITSTFDKAAQTTSFSAAVSGGEAAVLSGDVPTTLTGQDASLGKAFVQIVNEKDFVMPYTGLKGNAGLYVIAATLGASGLAATWFGVRRRRDDKQGE